MLLLVDFADQRHHDDQVVVCHDEIVAKIAEMCGWNTTEPQAVKIRLRDVPPEHPKAQCQVEFKDPPDGTPRIVIYVRPVSPISPHGWYAINNSLLNCMRRVVHVRSLDLSTLRERHEELSIDARDFGRRAREENEGASLWALTGE